MAAREPGIPNRWAIAAAGVVMQVALGAVYAWSVFRKPLTNEFGWSITEVSVTFSITIFTLGVAAFVGGLWMTRVGPRRVAMVSGLLYGLGVTLASLSDDRLWVLYLTYGFIGGAGIGLGYIVPVATLIKWFPDKRGMITGIAVAGFGAGALVTAPVATALKDSIGVLETFAVLGVGYFVVVEAAALFMRNPPQGYRPPGWEPAEAGAPGAEAAFNLRGALSQWQWYVLWAMLFLNVTAGIAIISQAAPMTEEITGVSELVAAGLVGIISIANAAGRFLWAWASDFIGRRYVFLSMFLLQAVVFFVMPSADSYAFFAILAFVVLLCYGGGFGTMPAFTADYFGAPNVQSIYGLMLTAWGSAGVLGPILIAAVRDSTGGYEDALYAIAGIMLVSAVLPFFIRPPRREEIGRPRLATARP